MTLCTDGQIRPDDIRLRTVGRADIPVADRSAEFRPAVLPEKNPAGAALGDRLEGMEREAIVHALEQTRYNKTAAAKLLGVTFRALRYRIKKLGIE
jgi:two-component system response regulator PilR (NtrC family)